MNVKCKNINKNILETVNFWSADTGDTGEYGMVSFIYDCFGEKELDKIIYVDECIITDENNFYEVIDVKYRDNKTDIDLIILIVKSQIEGRK